jgi:hypothetical protein
LKENGVMRNRSNVWLSVSALVLAGVLGCYNTPIDLSNYGSGPVPLREPSPARDNCCYEDSLTGGQVFDMYCSYCHNAPALSERPFANFRNVAAHMRIRANLTGKEYAKLMEFLRRWNDVPPPNPETEITPKRMIFAQPMQELMPRPAAVPEPTPAKDLPKTQ